MGCGHLILLLASPDPTKLPAAFFVAGALVDLSLITQDDLNRILPEGWRQNLK
jgi:hypothetical protein